MAEIANLCVLRFPSSTTRRTIFSGLKSLIVRLNEVGISGELWVDGSFVTEKPNPADADILLHVLSGAYDFEPEKRRVIDRASDEDRLRTHFCDAYKWVEYEVGHPLHSASEEDRLYWSDWYGRNRRGITKGIAVIELPAEIS